MKSPQVPFLPLGIGTLFVGAITFSLHAQSPKADEMRSLRFTSRGSSIPEGPAADFERPDRQIPPGRFGEAPTGFDNETNGFDQQGPPFEQINEDTVVRSVPSTTTGSSSKRWRATRAVLGQPTTRKAAASAIRMW